MGLTLRLLPVTHLHQGTWGICNSLLDLGGVDWDLGREISEKARHLPDGHNITAHAVERITEGTHQGERIYGKLDVDVYGEPYRWLTVSELIFMLRKHWPSHPVTAYVGAMEHDRLIVLDWH